MKALTLAGLVMLLILHQDIWNWNDATIVFGLPVGLTYHVGLCLAAAVVFFGLCKAFLPDDSEGRL